MRSSIVVAMLLCSNLVADMVFEEWNRQETQSFVNYQTQMDRAFVDMLQRDWQEYYAVEDSVHYLRPKPRRQPIRQSNPQIKEHIKVSPKLVTPTNAPTISKKRTPIGYQKIAFDFFSIGVEILYEQRFSYNIETISNSTIAKYWYKLSSSNYRPLLKQIREYREVYGLNDWATYLLVREITKQINYETNNRNLLSWFILVELGIDAKVGFSSNHISLLLGSRQKLYGVKYFSLNGKNYYQINNQENHKLKIYRGEIGLLHTIDFRDKIVKLPLDIKSREIRFVYQDREYGLSFEYNQNLVKLYKTYPQLDYNQYGQLSTISREFIHQKLSPLISNMSEIDAINFLLRLTQNGFRYKTDRENFGYEKVMFFEETLHYSHSDCEDRAIFFAQLVRELLHLPILFIKYPNHLATAISLPNSSIGGDTFIYKNQRYIIADPTYSSANIGQAMPDLEGVKFKIIEP